MTIKLTGSRETDYERDIRKARQFLDKFIGYSNLGGNEIIYSSLAGSHAKGLNNSRSDFDVMIYYKLSLLNLLKLQRHTLSTHPGDDFKRIEAEATLYEYDGSKFEAILTPIRSLGGAERDLWHGLAKQNADILYKFLRSYKLLTTPGMEAVKSFLVSEFRLEPDAIYGYFDGYSTSQLMAHRKQSSGQRKSGTQMQLNEVAKSIVEGVNMALSGALLLESQEMSFDFATIFTRYEKGFANPDFIWSVYGHKTDKRPIGEPPETYLPKSDVERDRIFKECKDIIHKARQSSPLQKLSDADKRFNTSRLDELFMEMYRAEMGRPDAQS
jgi:hypothetical protein